MELDIAELLAAVIDAAGGVVWVEVESLDAGYSDRVVTVDYDSQSNRFRLALADADDIEYEEE